MSIMESPPASDLHQKRAAFAIWLALQHLHFDSRLTQIVYFPKDAPDDEVRLLEVNKGLYPDPGQPIFAVRTTPITNDLPFHVWVADVTPDEWSQIQTDPGLLPDGWKWEGNVITRPAR